MNYQGGGVLRHYLLAWSRQSLSGYPHVGLAAAALVAMALCLWRRRWGLALVLAGTFAYVVAHSFLLAAVTRYTSTILPVWYVALAILLAEVRALINRPSGSAPVEGG